MSTILELLRIPNFPNANCTDVNPELMTPDTRAEMNFAKSICCKCEHKSECLEYALVNREVGVWGGTDDDEREAMLDARTRLGKSTPKPKRNYKHIVGRPKNRSKVSA